MSAVAAVHGVHKVHGAVHGVSSHGVRGQVRGQMDHVQNHHNHRNHRDHDEDDIEIRYHHQYSEKGAVPPIDLEMVEQHVDRHGHDEDDDEEEEEEEETETESDEDVIDVIDGAITGKSGESMVSTPTSSESPESIDSPDSPETAAISMYSQMYSAPTTGDRSARGQQKMTMGTVGTDDLLHDESEFLEVGYHTDYRDDNGEHQYASTRGTISMRISGSDDVLPETESIEIQRDHHTKMNTQRNARRRDHHGHHYDAINTGHERGHQYTGSGRLLSPVQEYEKETNSLLAHDSMALASSACSGTTTFTDPLDQDDDDYFPKEDRHQHSDNGGSGSETEQSPSAPPSSANSTDTGSFLGKDSKVKPPTFWEAIKSLKVEFICNFRFLLCLSIDFVFCVDPTDYGKNQLQPSRPGTAGNTIH